MISFSRFLAVLFLVVPASVAKSQDICRTDDSCAALKCKGICYETDCHGYCPQGQVMSSTDASQNKNIRIENAPPELEAKIKKLIEENSK